MFATNSEFGFDILVYTREYQCSTIPLSQINTAYRPYPVLLGTLSLSIRPHSSSVLIQYYLGPRAYSSVLAQNFVGSEHIHHSSDFIRPYPVLLGTLSISIRPYPVPMGTLIISIRSYPVHLWVTFVLICPYPAYPSVHIRPYTASTLSTELVS